VPRYIKLCDDTIQFENPKVSYYLHCHNINSDNHAMYQELQDKILCTLSNKKVSQVYLSEQVSKQFLNGTSTHYRPFSAMEMWIVNE